MDLKKISITVVGAGWLGYQLCECLTAAGYEIITTTTSLKKKEENKNKFTILVFDVLKNLPDQNLLASNILIYTIPPLGANEVERFFENVDPNKKIIYISSTSVYGKSQGVVDEETALVPISKNGRILKNSESYLGLHFKNLTIIRPGGLFNENHHPIYSLQGKTALTTGQELLHLVHLDDCIEAIIKIIEKEQWSEIFNLVNDLRIPKQEYYIEKAKELSLNPPQYLTTSETINRTNISNSKSKKMLLLQYKT